MSKHTRLIGGKLTRPDLLCEVVADGIFNERKNNEKQRLFSTNLRQSKLLLANGHKNRIESRSKLANLPLGRVLLSGLSRAQYLEFVTVRLNHRKIYLEPLEP